MHYVCPVYSEYGFAEKVVEGITLSINSIIIKISAKAFNASFELSQLQVYSVNTSWSISDLRFTRIQDPQRGEVRVGCFEIKMICFNGLALIRSSLCLL